MTPGNREKLFIFLALALIAACSDESRSGDATDTDADGADVTLGLDTRSDGEEDVITVGEVGSPDVGEGCDPRVLQANWPLHDDVSSGTIEVSEADGVFTATIDASAGGASDAVDNPFVYLDLEAGTRVDVTDFDSLENTTWDLAFRRVSVRTNSGDSGPGQVSLARLSNTTFDAVTDGPDDAEAYATDVTFDEDCEPLTDPIGNLVTAINYINQDNPSGSMSWYDYDGGVSPHEGDIYIVRNDDANSTYKLEFLSWTSGVYEIRWTEL